jgi:O-acetyl-ADP-ribose deacetylase (regulator of RNase III)
VRRLVAAPALVMALVAACGETRLPIGEECLRGADCLSGVCSSRTCVAAPALVTGVGGPPPDETARIPVADGGPDAPVDAPTEGG